MDLTADYLVLLSLELPFWLSGQRGRNHEGSSAAQASNSKLLGLGVVSAHLRTSA